MNKTSPIYSTLRILDIYESNKGDHIILNNDGSLGVLLKFNGINNSGFKSGDYSGIHSVITNMLKQIQSSEITINIHSIRNSNIEKHNDIPEDITPLISERVKWKNYLAKKTELFQNEFYISINSYPNGEELTLKEKLIVNIESLKQLFGTPATNEVLDLKLQTATKRIKKLRTVRDILISNLKTIGIQSKNYGEDDIWRVLQNYFRPFSSTGRYINRDKSETLRKDLFRGLECHEEQLYFINDEYLHQTFELEYLSHKPKVYENAITSISNTPFENILTISFRSLTKEESKESLDIQKKRARRAVNSSINRRGEVEDLDAQNDMDRLYAVDSKLADEQGTIVQIAASFTYRIKFDELNKRLEKADLTIDEFVLDNTIYLRNHFFSKVGDSEWRSPKKGQWDSFCAYTPGAASLLNNTYESLYELPENLPYLLPIYSQTRHDLTHYGNNHFFTDELGIETFNILDPTQNSWSYLISGDMGKGKSVTVNALMSMSLNSLLTSGKKPVIRLIDYGGVTSSFFKFASINDGQIVNLSKKNLPRINPLELDSAKSLPKVRKIKQLENLLEGKHSSNDFVGDIYLAYEEVLAIDDRDIADDDYAEAFKRILGINFYDYKDELVLKPGECIPDTRKTRIIMSCFNIFMADDPNDVNSGSTLFNYDAVLDLVKMAYEDVDGRYPTISDVVKTAENLLKSNSNDEYLELFIAKMMKWTINGQYKMFDAQTNVDLTNDFIMFDLFGVAEDQYLSALYNILILDLIVVDMYNKLDRDRVFLIDEAHAALRVKAFRDVTKNMLRLSRKYKFALVLASQLPSDWFESDPEVGKVLVSQATNFVFCGTDDAMERERAQQIYDLSDGQRDLLGALGIKTQGGTPNASVYSKFMLIKKQKNGSRTSVYRNILSPFEYNAYSSSKEDNAIFRFYSIKKGMQAKDIVWHITKKKHIGDKELCEYLRETNNLEALKQVEV